MFNVNRLTYLALLSLIVSLVACGESMKIVSDHDSLGNFSSYQTFAWRTGTQGRVTEAKRIRKNKDLEKRIHQEVNSQLEGLGYEKAETKNADFLISYKISTIRKDTTGGDITVIRESAKDVEQEMLRRGSNLDRERNEIETGLLTINIYDGLSKQRVWLGAAEDQIDFQNRSGEKLKKAVRLIIERFPKRETS